jgi:hypothetical protein
MTAVVAVRVDETPVLVGDVVLSNRARQRLDLWSGKVYALGDNVALGWSGQATLAEQAFRRLRDAVPLGAISADALHRALDGLSGLRNGQDRLEILGWFVGPDGAKVVRWASHYSPTMIGEAEGAIGDGGPILRRMYGEPTAAGSNVVGAERTVLKAATNFIEARFKETLTPRQWPQTWGVAFDQLMYLGRFLWLPAMTYVGWDVYVDPNDEIERVTQGSVVFKQERVDDCTVMHFKALDEARHEIRVSTPIYETDIDQSAYLERPFSASSPYYGNCFRIWTTRPTKHFLTIQLVSVGGTAEGLVRHSGSDDEPRFHVREEMLAPIVRDEVIRHRQGLRRRAQATRTSAPRNKKPRTRKPKGRRRG